MDDPAPIPPLRPIAANPADREGRRDQSPRREREQPAPKDATIGAVAAAPAAIVDDPLIVALDRLRTTDGLRTADLAVLRMWRGLRAYQDQAVTLPDQAPPSA